MKPSSPENMKLNENLKHFYQENGLSNFLKCKAEELGYEIENTKINKERVIKVSYNFTAQIHRKDRAYDEEIILKLGDQPSNVEFNIFQLSVWAEKDIVEQHLLRKFLEDARNIISIWEKLCLKSKIVLLKSILPFLESNSELFPNFPAVYNELAELYFKLTDSEKTASNDDRLTAAEKFLDICMSDKNQEWFDQKKRGPSSREKTIHRISERLLKTKNYSKKKELHLKKAEAWLLSRYDLNTASRISFSNYSFETIPLFFSLLFAACCLSLIGYYLFKISIIDNPIIFSSQLLFQFSFFYCLGFLLILLQYIWGSKANAQQIFMWAPEIFAIILFAGILILTITNFPPPVKTVFIMLTQFCVMLCYLPVFVISAAIILGIRKAKSSKTTRGTRHSHSSLFINTQIFLPRLIAGITAGYFLLLGDEAWKGLFIVENGLSITAMNSIDDLNLMLLGGRFLVPLLAVFAYIFIEMKNVPGIEIGKKPVRLFSRAFSYSIIIGVIISDIFGKGLCGLEPLGNYGVPGFLGNIYIEVLLYLAPLALFIGIFLQLLWDDKRLTDKI